MTKVQQEILDYLEERDWASLYPGDLAKSISIEAAELLEHFQWSHPTKEELRKDTEKARLVRREVADVLIYSLELCIALGLDHEEVIREKLQYAREKYPVDEVKHRGENYYKIKEQYRRAGKN
jgi:dCTP diphosphatase